MYETASQYFAGYDDLCLRIHGGQCCFGRYVPARRTDQLRNCRHALQQSLRARLHFCLSLLDRVASPGNDFEPSAITRGLGLFDVI
jgi:hypothetical protein